VVRGEGSTGTSRKPTPKPEVKPAKTLDVTRVTTKATIRTDTEVPTTVGARLPHEHTIRATTETTQVAHPAHDEPMVVETETITVAKPEPVTIPTEPVFFVDTNPSTSRKQILVPAYNVHPHTASLGENAQVEVESDPEDDVIVYDAPNPRISTPRVEPTTLANISFSNLIPSSTPRQINPLRRGKFVHVVGKNARRGGGVAGVKRKKLAEHGNFAAFGAMIAEARLRLQDESKDKDPKEHLRRQGDSDLDWGDETDEDERGGDPAVATAEGMDLDPDLVGSGVTTAAMERFVNGVNGNHVTMDDLEGADTSGDSASDDGNDEQDYSDEDGTDDEALENDEEMMLIDEFLADWDDPDFSDDEEEDDLDPRAGFQARLDRLRKKQQKLIETGEDEGEMDPDFQWGEGDEIDVCTIHVLKFWSLHAIPRTSLLGPWINTARIGWRVTRSSGPSRTAFSTTCSLKHLLRVGPQVEGMVFSHANDHVERKDVPAELQEQWEKDRLKKAKRRSERELARLEAALDPLVPKKGGKKSKKAMIAAAKLDLSIEIPHRIVDMVSVEQQIRRFLANKDRTEMALPPCDKGTRKKVHDLAALFELESKSKGGGLKRYTTLFKTGYSGKNIDEQKVARMMKGFKYRASYDVSDDDWDGRGKGKGKGKAKAKGKAKGKGKLKEKSEPGNLKTREGDVVGHVRAWSFIVSDSCFGSSAISSLFRLPQR
jgi:hypothetical protein